MKKFLVALLLASGVTYADTTANLITSPLSPTVPASAPEGYSGGSSVGYNSSTNTYYFGYTQQTIATTIAINNALQGSGVQVGGVNYGMTYLNGANSYGTLGLTVDVKNSTGNLLHTYSHSFAQNPNWQTFDQTQMFSTPYELSTLGSASMSITGRDSRFWAGYYGPQVKDPYLKLVYTAEVPVVTTPQFWDDTYVSVPLQFGFPFYGRTFTNSWMHSNGVVSFLDPAVPIPDVGYNPGQWAYCCGDRPTTTRPEFQYMIAPYWSDLYPDSVSTFRTEGTTQYQKYFWNNLGEISNTNNRSTFDLEIRPSGFIGVNYTQINGNQTYWAGTVGNPAAGEINEVFYGVPGLNSTALSNWSMQNTPVGDLCLVNPLSSPNCTGYTDAMCAANPLYSTTCSGYAAAYYTQQCSLNPLYDVNCPGYASAYLDYQCSLDPLYSTQCAGYEQAYLDQQCSISPLYSSACSDYTTAVNECSANPLTHSYCPSYQTAAADCSTNGLTHSYCPSYTLEQQLCSIDPLSNNLCSGYSVASTECSTNQLSHSYCPSYSATLQVCTTNPLSNELCPDYKLAKAALDAALAPVAVTTSTETITTTEATPTISSDGTVSATVSVTGDSTVDSAINTTATSTSPAAAATATVSLAPVVTTEVTAPQVEAKPETKTEETQEAKNDAKESTGTSNAQASAGTGGSTSTSDKKPNGPTMRQQIAAKRAEAARTAEVKAGGDAAKELDTAPTFAAQVAVQNVVVAAMGFNPSFDVYKTYIMKDVVGYKPFDIYKNQKTVDNARVLRRMGGASDRLHEQMIASQYNRGD